MIKFSETGRKLRDGVIPAGTTVWKKIKSDGYSAIAELIVLADGVIPTRLRAQVQACRKNLPRKIITTDTFGMKCWGDRKCRVPKAYVRRIVGCYDNKDRATGCSFHDNLFTYTVGSVVEVPDYNGSPDEVCTQGIHVFLTRDEAVEYNDF